jgi:hypothetical protein
MWEHASSYSCAKSTLQKVNKEPGSYRRAFLSPTSSTAPEGAPVSGGGGEMKVLQKMNDLQDCENENWSRESV